MSGRNSSDYPDRDRDRDRRWYDNTHDPADDDRRREVRHESYRRRSPDRRSSSNEYEDYSRVESYNSGHRRSEARRDRSRSPTSRSYHSHSKRSDGDSSRRRRHRHSRHHDAEEELEEGQCLPEEDDEDFIFDRNNEAPNATIMLRGLGNDVHENDILAELARYELQPKDIRLMRHKETGAPRGFAFVEFTCLEDAVHWKKTTQGRLQLNGCHVTLHYSVSKDNPSEGPSAVYKNDWTCYKCGVNNFKRRDVCFKCETEREESEANDTGDELSPTPTNCLLLRNLSLKTTSDQILSLVSSLTNAPIRSIRFPKDPVYNMPRGVCYLELHTTSEAIQLLALINSMDTSFLVDSAPLLISYAKRQSTFSVSGSGATSAANAALAAAHWTNQRTGDTSGGTTAAGSCGVVSVKGVSYPKFPKPDPSLFQLEETSGFYYDSSTRLYYDPKSTYYFNSLTQQYLYYSDDHHTYLPAESASTSSATATATTSAALSSATSVASKDETEKQKTPDKVKTAKKIAKDMEKWAKTLNQRTSIRQERVADVFEHPLSSDQQQEESASQILAPVDPVAVRRQEESKLIDWSKLLCLLCKRQFVSNDQLNKHLQLSDLHKNNLNSMLRSVLSPEQMDSLVKRDGQYIDRASERRRKWGLDAAAEPNEMKEKYMAEMAAEAAAHASKKATERIDSSNKGSKMLKAMGWKEGEGLGRRNEGRTDIIHVESRPESLGLGNESASRPAPGETLCYKDAVKRAMAQRYKEISKQSQKSPAEV